MQISEAILTIIKIVLSSLVVGCSYKLLQIINDL